VQIDPPVTLLSTAGVFNNNNTATSAQLAIYSQMYTNSESYFMARNCGLLSDELATNSTVSDYQQYYLNAMFATSGPGPWTTAYQYIYEANAIIEELQKSNGVSKIVMQQLVGEAKFVRAFWCFYLVNCYGDVPLVISTDYTVNANLTRTPKDKVYQQILSDLNDARKILSSNYVDFSDTTVTNERTRPTRWAAYALLSRVYLQLGKYDSVELAASEVINHVDLYELKPNLNDVFLANSKEAIWQLQTPLPSSFSTLDGNGFILTAAPSGNDVFFLSSQLIDSFEIGDYRRNNWIHDTVFAGVNYSYSYKYNQKFYASSPQEYTMVLRLAEQYLIRAEARAKSGKLTGSGSAVADLNMIRYRAGLGDYAGSSDQNSILNSILRERQLELFTEWGHRWFDLIRMEKINEVMSVITPIKGGVWSLDGYQQLFPIPQSEININNKLTQNPEY